MSERSNPMQVLADELLAAGVDRMTAANIVATVGGAILAAKQADDMELNQPREIAKIIAERDEAIAAAAIWEHRHDDRRNERDQARAERDTLQAKLDQAQGLSVYWKKRAEAAWERGDENGHDRISAFTARRERDEALAKLDRAMKVVEAAQALVEERDRRYGTNRGDAQWWSAHDADWTFVRALDTYRAGADAGLQTEARGHVYLSTACLHGEHDYCKSREREDGGTKVPSRCKFCPAPCVCQCHKETDDD